MIAVIFEVQPIPGRASDYLEIAARLRPVAESIDGFISIERFESLAQPGKILSLSLWRDEKVVRDYGMHDRDQAPEDSKAAHPR
jgi:heme-degrading monooxygenase HmoA